MTELEVARERALSAITEFRRMLPMLTGFARAYSGNPLVRVVASISETYTDGKVIHIEVPLSLADKVKHDVDKCGKWDINNVQMCPACVIRNDIVWSLYHEISHIWAESFAKIGQRELRDVSQFALAHLREAGVKISPEFVRLVEDNKIQTMDIGWATLCKGIAPFLDTLANCFEDARVNYLMEKARPGLTRWRRSMEYRLLSGSTTRYNARAKREVTTSWSDRPYNFQMGISLYMAALDGLDGMTYLAHNEYVRECMKDPRILEIVNSIRETPTQANAFVASVKSLAIMQEMGFFGPPELPTPTSEEDDDDSKEEREDDEAEDDSSDEYEDAQGEDDDEADGDEEDKDWGDDEEDGEDDQDDEDEGGEEGDDSKEDGEDDSEDGDGELESESPEASGNEEGDEDSDSSSEADDDDSGSGDGSGGEADEDDSEYDEYLQPFPNQELPSEGHEDQDDSDEEGQDSLGEDEEVPMGGDDSGDDGDQSQDPSSDKTHGSPELGSGEAARDESEEGETEDPGDGNEDGGAEPDESDVGEDEGDDDSPGEEHGEGDEDETGTGESGDSTPSSEVGEETGEDGVDGEGVEGGNQSGEDEGSEKDSKPEAESTLESTSDKNKGGAKKSATGDRTLPEDTTTTEEPERPSAQDNWGDDEEVLEELDEFFGHSHGDEEGEGVDPLTKSALVQALKTEHWFDRIPRNVTSVRWHRDGDHWTDKNDVSTARAWTHAYRGTGYNFYRYSREELGIDGDFTVPLGVIGRAILKARIAFGNNAKRHEDRNQKTGRVDSRVLGKRGPVDDPRVFKKGRRPEKRDYFVVITGDLSGSTHGENLLLIKRAMMTQAEILSRLGIKFVVWGHSAQQEPLTQAEADAGKEYNWAVQMYVIKDAHEAWNDVTRGRLTELGPDDHNLDGHTLQLARREAESTRATDKIIMYYTDGAMPAANAVEELEILRSEIEYCKRKGINLMAVGIRTDSPEQFGFDYVRVDEDDDMLKVVSHLEKRLLR